MSKLLIILTYLINQAAQFETDFNGLRSCKSLTKCDCLQPTDPTLPIEIHCPDFSDDQMQLYYRLNSSLVVQCLPPLNWDAYNIDAIQEEIHEVLQLNGNISLLKSVRLNQVEDVKVSHCDLTMSNRDLESLILATQPKYLSLRSNILLSDTLLLSEEEIKENVTNRIYDSIETLNLENNNLIDIPYLLYAKMQYLRYISLNFNKITNISQTFNANTLSLELAQNSIDYIDQFAFAGLKYLQTLHLWGNNISSIESFHFKDLGNLHSLELSRNVLLKLSYDVFSHLKSLKSINLESNSLQNLPNNLFEQNQELESIRLGRNEYLTEVPDRLFSNLPKLKNVHLNSCGLARLGQNMFDNSYNVEVIYLQDNILFDLDEFLFKGLRKLQVLNLADNKLRCLPKGLFVDLVSLSNFDLSGNFLTVTSSEVLKEISTWTLGGNYSDVFL